VCAGNEACASALLDVQSITMLTSQLQCPYGSLGALEVLQDVFGSAGGGATQTEGLIPLVQSLLRAVQDRLDKADGQRDMGVDMGARCVKGGHLASVLPFM
jgi:hypothetical protein